MKLKCRTVPLGGGNERVAVEYAAMSQKKSEKKKKNKTRMFNIFGRIANKIAIGFPQLRLNSAEAAKKMN